MGQMTVHEVQVIGLPVLLEGVVQKVQVHLVGVPGGIQLTEETVGADVIVHVYDVVSTGTEFGRHGCLTGSRGPCYRDECHAISLMYGSALATAASQLGVLVSAPTASTAKDATDDAMTRASGTSYP